MSLPLARDGQCDDESREEEMEPKPKQVSEKDSSENNLSQRRKKKEISK